MRKIALLLSVAMISTVFVGLTAGPSLAMGATHDPGASHNVIVSADPADFTPHVLDGAVKAFTRIGNTMFAGGVFTQVKQPNGVTLSRTNLFAFNATTGVISSSFAPTINGEVDALVTDGTSLFVGGLFQTVNGTTANRLAELDPVTGALVPGFKGKISSGASVRSMAVSNGTLYVGGAFSVVNGQSRQRLAALDAATGTLDPSLNVAFAGKHNDGQTRVEKLGVSPDGTKLVAIGNFTTADGLDRDQIAMIDLTTSPKSVSSWKTDRYKATCSSRFDTYMHDVDFAPDGSYFIVVTTGAFVGGANAGVLCDTTTRWESNAQGPGQQPTWADYTGGDTTWSGAATGAAIYVGGHMRWENNAFAGDALGPGAVARKGIAALDPVNGVPFSWNPSKDRGEGVYAFYVTNEGLWVGSDTDHIANEYHAKIGFLPVAGGESVPPATQVPLPNDLWSLPLASAQRLDHRSFTGSAFGTLASLQTPGVDWSQARGAFVTNGKLYSGWNNGSFYSRPFDGTTLGAATQIDLHGLTSSYFNVANVTGMFFTNGRLYYTVANDARLFYRYFTPESDIVGGVQFVASGAGDGLNWSTVQGMTLASGRIYFAKSDNNLYGINFTNGIPVPGTQNLISGPSTGDGRTWSSRGLFVLSQANDTFPPSKPGTPSAASTTPGTVDLSWGAASDAVSTSLTYHVYRNDGSGDVLAGTVTSSSTGTVSFSDTGLTPDTSLTYSVDATDAASNTGPRSSSSAPVVVQAPDQTPPTAPGTPTGAASGKTKIDLSWAASTDAVSSSLTYQIYRNGVAIPGGTVTSSSTGTVSYTDTGLDPATPYTYTVDATDAANNTSALSPASDPIMTLGDTFADGFDDGTLGAWTTVTRMTIDQTAGATAPPSALAAPNGQSAFAAVNLSATLTTSCMSVSVRVNTPAASTTDLFRLRTAANGGIASVDLTAAGKLLLISNVSGLQKATGTVLPAGWNDLELCGTVGSAGTWDLYLNGSKIVNGWVADTGSVPVGRVQIGYNQAATDSVSFDDVVVDQTPG